MIIIRIFARLTTLQGMLLVAWTLFQSNIFAGPLDTLQPGQWYMAPNSNVSARDPCPLRNCSYSGVGGQPELITAWNGGAYDTTRDRLLIWGGGHNDYGGNEIYAFDIATMAWTMVIGPTAVTAADRSENNATNYYSDGRPSSRHSGSALVYAANVDQFFSMAAGATYGDPAGGGFNVDSFNFNTNAWKTNWTQSPGNAYGTNSTIAAYHPGTGKIWFHASMNSPLAAFDPAANGGTAPNGTGSWTSYGSQYLEIYSTPILDTKRNRYIAMGGYAGARQFFVWDLNNPNNAPTTPATSGVSGGLALESAQAPGFIYDPIGDRYIAWHGGTTVYALNPETWVWSVVTLYSGNTVTPTAPSIRGTFNRMQYIPSKNAFVVVNRTEENVYFFKLGTAAPSTTPTVSFSASQTSVISGGSSTLTWSSTNATTCRASGAWSGTKATSGSQSIGALTSTATYTLTCTGAGGAASQSTTVTVTPGTSPPPGAITTVQLINTSSSTQTNPATTFGHVFKQGDVPSGFTVIAKDASNNPVTLQVDKKATHPDGSLRHAILTARLPSLGAAASQTIYLYAQADSAPTTPVSLANLLATSFDAQVSLNVGGTVYTATARNLLQTATPKIWLAGTEVSEWIVGGPVKTAGGTAHPHLAAYFHVRAYAGSPITRVRVDTVVENNWTLVSGPSDLTYLPTVTVGSTTLYNNGGSNLLHYDHTRWHQVGWWNNTDSNLYVKHDTAYLQDTKAIPKYETLTPTEAFLNSVRQSTPPMDKGDQTEYMDNGGAQDAIAPLPRWDAVYAVSGDRRAFNYMKANADGGAVYGIHFRDENTGYPVTIDSYPNSSYIDPNSSTPVIPEPSTANRNNEGSGASHQPSIGYLPYLLTGDYYFLEEMQFWSSFNLIWTGVSARRGVPAYGQTSGAYGIFYDGAIRGQAWFIRNLAHVASVTPDAHPLKNYFTTKLNNNLAYWTWQYVNGNSPDANALGAMFSGEKNNTNEYRGFFDNYMSWAIQHVVELGFTNAAAFRDYKLKLPIGLMGLAANEFCFQLAPTYNWRLGPANTTYYSTFQEVYNATSPGSSAYPCGSQAMANYLTAANGRTFILNEMIGGQSEVDYLFANLQIALAAAADSGLPGGTNGWARSRLSGIRPDYRNSPGYALIPRAPVSP